MSKRVEEIFLVAINTEEFCRKILIDLKNPEYSKESKRSRIDYHRCQLDYASGLGTAKSQKEFQDLILDHYREEIMGYGVPWPWECSTEVKNPCNEVDIGSAVPCISGPTMPPQPKQENTMIKVETKVFVNGTDIKILSDDTLFQMIQSTEKEIDKLLEIKTKPKKLVARIKELEDGLKTLVETMDDAI